MWPTHLTLRTALLEYGRTLYVNAAAQADELDREGNPKVRYYCGDWEEDMTAEDNMGVLEDDFNDAVFQMWRRTQERYPNEKYPTDPADWNDPFDRGNKHYAAKFLSRHSGYEVSDILNDPKVLDLAYQTALSFMTEDSPAKALPNLAVMVIQHE